VDRSVKGRLTLAVVFTAIIFFAELFGGYVFNSLALLSDAAHVFMDVFALGLSLFAIYISGLPPTDKKTFGFHRVEVLVSFLNGVTLLFVSLFIFYKAYTRFMEPQEIESLGMLAVAAVGLLVNLVVALWLSGHAKHDLNVKSAFFHVIGDAVASVGVIAAGVIIYFTGWYRVDSIISVFIGMIIIAGAVRIIEESTHILLEGVPKDIDLNEVVESMKSQKGVTGIHSLHIWSICHNIYALTRGHRPGPQDQSGRDIECH
jgi:cobalt-zinc-cadmium efflux system protein